MAEARSIKITYNGVDLTDSFTRDALNQQLNEVAERALKEGLSRAMDDIFQRCVSFPLRDEQITPVRTRVATRQSCLWRHSFDWRNRKRGHPTHR